MDLDKACYGYSKLVAIDPVVYAVIDLAGLAPGIDNFADGAGLLYATFRTDTEQMGAYTLGLAMAGVGTLAVKYGGKAIKAFYKGSLWVIEKGGVYKVLVKLEAKSFLLARLLKVDDYKKLFTHADQLHQLIKDKQFTRVHLDLLLKEADEGARLAKLQKMLDLEDVIKQLDTDKANLLRAELMKTENLLKGLVENPKLVDAWEVAKEAKVADVLRKNPEFLKEYDILRKNDELKKHVFDGEIKKNSVKGGHLSDAFDGNNFRLGDGSTDLSKLPQNSKGVRKIDESIGVQKKKILKDVQGNIIGERWLDKNIDPLGGHTLFPEGWSTDKIIEEVSSAIANPIKSNWGGKSNAFKATSHSGVEIGWFVDANGSITTFFPIF